MAAFAMTAPRLRLGIVTNEVLDPAISRTGGFGYAASTVAAFFTNEPALGVDPVIVACEALNVIGRGGFASTNGIPIMLWETNRETWEAALRSLGLELFLCIDYRPSYDSVLDALPRTPTLVWVRDPRTWDDYIKVSTLRIPGSKVTPPGSGLGPVRGLRRIAVRSLLTRRPLHLRATATELVRKVWKCYGVPPWGTGLLPNIIVPANGTIRKDDLPLVVFLGRLDPIKRPWIALEVARQLPAVRFAFLGANHFPDTWSPRDVPPNCSFLGYLDGRQKDEMLERAWLIINSSIHEGLAVSFLEALKSEAPIVSCQNTEGLAARFGAFVGRWDGDGLGSVEAFVNAIRDLVASTEKRRSLGAAGRRWVQATHSREQFLEHFRAAVRRSGLHPS